MDVRDVAHSRFGRRAFDAEIVEANPGELHGLNRKEHRRQRNRREASFDQKRGGGMVDSEHMTFQSKARQLVASRLIVPTPLFRGCDFRHACATTTRGSSVLDRESRRGPATCERGVPPSALRGHARPLREPNRHCSRDLAGSPTQSAYGSLPGATSRGRGGGERHAGGPTRTYFRRALPGRRIVDERIPPRAPMPTTHRSAARLT